MERLDKILASQGTLSRRDVKEIIKKGRVTLNGAVVGDSAVKVDLNTDTVAIDGEKITLKKHIYIMMNKPQGVISASDSEDDETVVDLVPDELFRKGLFPAGRLDKDTTGFVLITDDGDFAHKILSPKNHIFKTYLARLQHELTQNDIETLEKGITLADGTTLKEAKVECELALDYAEKNYYDIIAIYVTILMELEEDDLAIKVLEEELEMPYIPYKYEVQELLYIFHYLLIY